MKNKKTKMVMLVVLLGLFNFIMCGLGSGQNWTYLFKIKAGSLGMMVCDTEAGGMLEVSAIQGKPMIRMGDLQDNWGDQSAALSVYDVISLEGKTIANGDIDFPVSNHGIIMTSPNGSRFRLTVSDTGELNIEPTKD